MAPDQRADNERDKPPTDKRLELDVWQQTMVLFSLQRHEPTRTAVENVDAILYFLVSGCETDREACLDLLRPFCSLSDCPVAAAVANGKPPSDLVEFGVFLPLFRRHYGSLRKLIRTAHFAMELLGVLSDQPKSRTREEVQHSSVVLSSAGRLVSILFTLAMGSHAVAKRMATDVALMETLLSLILVALRNYSVWLDFKLADDDSANTPDRMATEPVTFMFYANGLLSIMLSIYNTPWAKLQREAFVYEEKRQESTAYKVKDASLKLLLRLNGTQLDVPEVLGGVLKVACIMGGYRVKVVTDEATEESSFVMTYPYYARQVDSTLQLRFAAQLPRAIAPAPEVVPDR